MGSAALNVVVNSGILEGEVLSGSNEFIIFELFFDFDTVGLVDEHGFIVVIFRLVGTVAIVIFSLDVDLAQDGRLQQGDGLLPGAVLELIVSQLLGDVAMVIVGVDLLVACLQLLLIQFQLQPQAFCHLFLKKNKFYENSKLYCVDNKPHFCNVLT